MNESEFAEEDINGAVTEQFDFGIDNWQPSDEIEIPKLPPVYRVFQIVCLALGIPGNILSAIVWLRRHVDGKNSSAIYLAVLAINDFVFLLMFRLYQPYECFTGWICQCASFLLQTTENLEPLLVLGFSLERLIAICCPLRAKLWCSTSRARKVVVGLALFSPIPAIINTLLQPFYEPLALPIYRIINIVVFLAIVPVAVLVINVVVAVQVRRAASNAAANQRSHHTTPTSNNSAVPTVMLVATSLVYVLLLGAYTLIAVVNWSFLIKGDYVNFTLDNIHMLVGALSILVYVYNFYVYLITGKQFRSDLRKLFCFCPCFSSAEPAADNAEVARRGRHNTAV